MNDIQYSDYFRSFKDRSRMNDLQETILFDEFCYLSFLLELCEYLFIMWNYSRMPLVNNSCFADALQIVHSRYLSFFSFLMRFVSMEHCFYSLAIWFIDQTNTAGIAYFPWCDLKSTLVNLVNIESWMFCWVEFSSVITELRSLQEKNMQE